MRLHLQPTTIQQIIYRILSIAAFVLFSSSLTDGQASGPICDSYSNVTTATSNGITSTYVRGVYAVGNHIYAATANGGLSISTNGGNTFTWKGVNDGLGSDDVYGVYAIGNTVYAATSGGLSISTNDGRTFTTKINPTNSNYTNKVRAVYAVAGPTSTTIYAATLGGISITTDGGNTFVTRDMADGLGNDFVNSIYVVGDTIYAATDGGLSISTNGGTSFINYTTDNGLGSNQVRGVSVAGTRIYAATYGGGLSISTDRGNHFFSKTVTNSSIRSHLLNAVHAQGDTVYAGTDGDGKSVSFDGGNTFSDVVALGYSSFIYGIYVTGNTIYAAINGGLYISADGGTSFIIKNTDYTNVLNYNFVTAVYALDNRIYAATYGGGLSIMTNDFSSFSVKTTANGLGSNYVFGVFAVTGPGSTTVYAATESGVSISLDGGNTFTNHNNGLVNPWVNDVFVDGTTIYAATQWGLGISTNGGNSFTLKTTTNGLGDVSVNGVYAVGNIVYAATFTGLSISTDGGNSFINHTTNYTTPQGVAINPVYGVYVQNNVIYTATYGGGLMLSADGGKTFVAKTTANGLGSDYMKKVYVVGNTIYASTNGGLSISTNGGNSFISYTTNNGLGSNAISGVAVSGNNTIYAATSGGLSYCSGSVLSDLTPVIYVQPSTQYGTTQFGAVVDVFELNSASTTGPVVVKVNKSSQVKMSFSPNASSIAGRSVTNSAWSFDNSSDPDYYILTTNQNIAAGSKLSFGLNCTLNPGATSGSLSISSVILAVTSAEANVLNNIDADKFDYFQQ